LNLTAGTTGCPAASFEPARKTEIGPRPNQHGRSGDFNGDGKLDLVVEYDAASDAYLLLGKGNGYFETPKLLFPNPFSYSVIHAVADFNGDGRSDLILWDPNPALYLGRSDGGFDRTQADLALNVLVAKSIVEADFNGDGKADLAGGMSEGPPSMVVVRLNSGAGAFAPETKYEIGMPVSSVYIKAGDVDGDSDLDLIRISDASIGSVIKGGLVLRSYTNTVSVLMNNGDGTFRAGPSRYAGAWIMTKAAVADFNGDGKADLACSHHYDFDPYIPQESVAVLLGNGDGTFGAPALWDADYHVHFIFTGDFNGDGAVDLGTGLFPGGVRILLGNGDGTFQTPGWFILGLDSNPNWERSSQIVGDFNGDGQADFATETSRGVQVAINACRPPPEPPNGLAIQRRNQAVALSWPLVPSGSLLEATTNRGMTGWSAVLGNISTNQNRLEVEAPIEGAQRYFRLREPGP
jgi:hypothetical protein